jgi:hypothetical protein
MKAVYIRIESIPRTYYMDVSILATVGICHGLCQHRRQFTFR